MRAPSVIIILLISFGIIYRIWPIFFGMPDLSTFFITEDGYLLLTVARNLGTGNGMTVSDGLIATNGIQPLITFFFAAAYWATEGDKITGLVWIHIIHAVIGLIGVFAVRALAARLLAPRDPDPIWPWAVAFLWFLGPVPLRHSMNGLETGLVTVLIVATLAVLHRRLETVSATGRGLDLALGAMCGLTILARVDAGVFAVLVFSVWAAALWTREGRLSQVVSRLLPAGMVTTLIAGPWFARNVLVFGDLMPTSGEAQKMSAELGENLPLLPAKAFETAFSMIPLPSGVETLVPVQVACVAALALVITVFIVRLNSQPLAAKLTGYAGLLYGVFLAVYYGTFFGAGHFLSRYLAPLSPILIIATLAACLELGRRFPLRRTLVAWLYAGGGTMLSCLFLVLLLGPLRIPQGHETVIEWTQENVSDSVWVGAVQTGTLGYWHDRTINLDGKVNPEALAARLEMRVLDYVVESPIDYVIDWAGVGNWVTSEEAKKPGGFGDVFELVLQDEARNLSVMARRNR